MINKQIELDEAGVAFDVNFGEAEGVQAGYKEGYKDGKAEGYSKGEAEGQAKGYQEGHTAGYTEGYGVGEAAGHTAGYTEGYDNGSAAGQKAEHDKFWDVFQENGKRTNYPNTYGSFAGYAFTFDNFYPKYDIRPEGNAKQLFYAWILQRGNVIGSLTQRLKDCGVVLDTSKATSLINMFGYSCFTELPTISFVSDTSSSANEIRGIFANNPYLETIEKIIVTENTYYRDWFTNDTNFKNVAFEGVIGQDGLDFSPCKDLTYDSCHSIFTHLKDFRGKIVDNYTYLYDWDSRTQILGTHTLVAGAEYSLYHSNPGYGAYSGTATAQMINVPNVGNVLGLQYDFPHPVGYGFLTKYIYQSGDSIVLYESENGAEETIVSLTTAPTETRTITMPKAVRDNGNATPQDIAETIQKGWTISWS